MSIQSQFRAGLRRVGVDVSRWPEEAPAHRRVRLLETYDIDVVLDVGANDGDFALELRRHGFQNRIVSLEPIHQAYEKLQARTSSDEQWTAVRCALGDRSGQQLIHVAANNARSSSFLPMLTAHEHAAPDARYLRQETVDVRTLDEMWDEIVREQEICFLKLDVQGFERAVLSGARACLRELRGLQLELSLVPLYQGGPTYEEMVPYITGLGFQLMGVEPGFYEKHTGRLLQMDGIFYRATDSR